MHSQISTLLTKLGLQGLHVIFHERENLYYNCMLMCMYMYVAMHPLQSTLQST